jgi:hypothetical protein
MNKLKNIIILFVFFIFVNIVLSFCEELDVDEKIFTHEDGLVAYFSMTGKKPDNDFYEMYAKYYYPDIYNKYRNDEFEWGEKLKEIKNEFNEKVKNYDIKTKYFIITRQELGKYDFDNNGFVCKFFNKDTYFSIRATSDPLLYWTQVSEIKLVNLFFINPDDFNFLPYEKESANEFIKSRKNKYTGDVDREVKVIVHFTLVPIQDKNAQKILSNISLPSLKSSYNLVAKIESIEVYKNDEEKMDVLIKKDLTQKRKVITK